MLASISADYPGGWIRVFLTLSFPVDPSAWLGLAVALALPLAEAEAEGRA